jgi:hypothetical protein
LNGHMVRPEPLGIAIRLFMAKSGLPWAFENADAVQPLHQAPTLTERFARINQIIEQRLDADAAADAPPA